MNQKEIHDLIKLINKTNISEFKIKDGEFSLSIRTKDFQLVRQEQQILPVVHAAAPQQNFPAATATPQQPALEDAPDTRETEKKTEDKQVDKENLVTFKSPMIGTFYRRPSPDKETFVKVGDDVKSGDILCIIEAMKLFNEIESEIEGKIVEVLVEDSSPVEYDQPLFLIDPA